MNTATEHYYRTCGECERVFDLLHKDDVEEWYGGHDCEEPMGPNYWGYIFEIRELLGLPQDANVSDEEMTAQNGPSIPAERMYTISMIFGDEEWEFPEIPSEFWPPEYNATN